MQFDGCIICGSLENLDTELTITIDDEKIVVKVCSDHADDITPKIAKSAYLKKKSSRDTEIEEFLKQAKKLGLTVVQGNGSGLDIVQNTACETTKHTATERQTQNVPKPKVLNELRGSRNDGILSTSEVDNAMKRVMGTSGAIDGANVEHHNAYNIDDLANKLPDGVTDGLVKMELAEGRQGTPLALPAIRQDGLGTTRICIAKTMTDADLQRRSRALADRSFKDGYNVKHCIMCAGDGHIRNNNETIICPKCHGSGIL